MRVSLNNLLILFAVLFLLAGTADAQASCPVSECSPWTIFTHPLINGQESDCSELCGGNEYFCVEPQDGSWTWRISYDYALQCDASHLDNLCKPVRSPGDCLINQDPSKPMGTVYCTKESGQFKWVRNLDRPISIDPVCGGCGSLNQMCYSGSCNSGLTCSSEDSCIPRLTLNGNSFTTGSYWTLQLTSSPAWITAYQNVYICSTIRDLGGAWGKITCTPASLGYNGATDSYGNWYASGIFYASDAGNSGKEYTEWAVIGSGTIVTEGVVPHIIANSSEVSFVVCPTGKIYSGGQCSLPLPPGGGGGGGGGPPVNNAPILSSLSVSRSVVNTGAVFVVSSVASDPDGNPVTLSCAGLSGTCPAAAANPSCTFISPWIDSAVHALTCSVSDGLLSSASGAATITSDNTVPTLIFVHIASSNANASLARTGDVVALTFTASEAIQPPAASIGGHAVTATNIFGNQWSTAYTMQGTDPEGAVAFMINFQDIAGNAAVRSATTDSSYVIFDMSPPVITVNNPSTGPAQNKTITATASEGTLYYHTNNAGDNTCDGSLPFIPYVPITFLSEADNGKRVCYGAIDAAGNQAFALSNAIAGIDRTAPILTSVHIQSNGTRPAYAKTDDVITVTFNAGEAIQPPAASISGHPATVSGSGPYSAVYSMAASDAEGIVAFSISFSDIAGNAAVQSATTDSSYVLFDRTAPSVNAGPDQTAGSQFTQTGAAADTRSGIASYLWTQQNGPGSIAFGTPAAITTTINASADGIYIIRLTAADNAGNAGYGEMTLNWSTWQNATNSTITNSTISNSSITNSTISNSTVSNSTVTNSTVSSSNVTNSTVTNSTVTVSTVSNSTVTNSSVANSSITNSTVNNSTVLNSTVSNSTIGNSTVSNSTVGNSAVSNSNVNNSALSNSTITNSTVTNSTISNSTATNSNVTNSTVTNSTISNSTVSNSTVGNSTVSNSTVSNSSVTNSIVTNSTVESSTVTNSSITNSSTVINSTATNSSVSNSTVTNSTVSNSVISNSTAVNSNVTNSSASGSTVSNSTLSNSNVTNSNVTSSAVSNSTVTNSTAGNSAISDSAVSNSTVTNSTVTNSTINNSTVSNSTVSNSTVSNSAISNSAATSSNVTNSNATNSIVVNSTISDSVVSNSTTINSTISNSTVSSSVISNSTIYNSTTANSSVTNSSVTNSAANNSTVANSTAANSDVNNSTVINSSVTDSSVANSTIYNSTVTDSAISNSAVNGSTIINSSVTASDVVNSSIDSGILYNSSAFNSTMLNSTISNSIVSGAVIINNIIYNGTISFNGTLYNATSNGTANLTSIIDYPPDAVLTAPATGMTASTILLNGSGSSDANIPGPMNDSLTYIFAFGDGSSYTESASNATDGAYDGMTTHAYPNAGNYTVTLTVIDIFGLSDSSTTTIRIDAPPPPPPPPPAGGGSGGGGYYFYGTVIYMNATNATNITVMAALNQTNATVSNQTGMCTESWACSGWTQCTSGLQTRTCSDLNNCSTTAGKPPETQFCGANQTGGQGALSLTAFLLANPVTAGAAVIAAIVILWLAYMAWQHFIRPKRHA